jgi:hypothetical protein
MTNKYPMTKSKKFNIQFTGCNNIDPIQSLRAPKGRGNLIRLGLLRRYTPRNDKQIIA